MPLEHPKTGLHSYHHLLLSLSTLPQMPADLLASLDFLPHGHSHGPEVDESAVAAVVDARAMWFAAGSIAVKEWLYRASKSRFARVFSLAVRGPDTLSRLRGGENSAQGGEANPFERLARKRVPPPLRFARFARRATRDRSCEGRIPHARPDRRTRRGWHDRETRLGRWHGSDRRTSRYGAPSHPWPVMHRADDRLLKTDKLNDPSLPPRIYETVSSLRDPSLPPLPPFSLVPSPEPAAQPESATAPAPMTTDPKVDSTSPKFPILSIPSIRLFASGPSLLVDIWINLPSHLTIEETEVVIRGVSRHVKEEVGDRCREVVVRVGNGGSIDRT